MSAPITGRNSDSEANEFQRLMTTLGTPPAESVAARERFEQSRPETRAELVHGLRRMDEVFDDMSQRTNGQGVANAIGEQVGRVQEMLSAEPDLTSSAAQERLRQTGEVMASLPNHLRETRVSDRHIVPSVDKDWANQVRQLHLDSMRAQTRQHEPPVVPVQQPLVLGEHVSAVSAPSSPNPRIGALAERLRGSSSALNRVQPGSASVSPDQLRRSHGKDEVTMDAAPRSPSSRIAALASAASWLRHSASELIPPRHSRSRAEGVAEQATQAAKESPAGERKNVARDRERAMLRETPNEPRGPVQK